MSQAHPTEQPSPLALAAQGKAPEVSVSKDMIRRGLIVTPVLLLASGAIWGINGAWSAAVGIGLVLANFGLAALLISWAAPISLALMMGVSLFGYLIRLGLVSLAIFLLKDVSWIHLTALGIVIIVTHLGLLFWEMKYIAASLAFPGLRPNE